MKILIIALGIIFGAVEFLLTKTVSDRVMQQKKFLLPLIAKLLSYGVVLVIALFVLKSDFIVPFGVSAGGSLLVTGLIVSIYHIVKEKR